MTPDPYTDLGGLVGSMLEHDGNECHVVGVARAGELIEHCVSHQCAQVLRVVAQEFSETNTHTHTLEHRLSVQPARYLRLEQPSPYPNQRLILSVGIYEVFSSSRVRLDT